MNSIRYIKLRNCGGFVAQMALQYSYSHKGFVAGYKTYTETGYHDVLLGQSRIIDLKNIPDIEFHAIIIPEVDVVLGGWHRSKNQYLYDPESTNTASFIISGTVFESYFAEEN